MDAFEFIGAFVEEEVNCFEPGVGAGGATVSEAFGFVMAPATSTVAPTDANCAAVANASCKVLVSSDVLTRPCKDSMPAMGVSMGGEGGGRYGIGS